MPGVEQKLPPACLRRTWPELAVDSATTTISRICASNHEIHFLVTSERAWQATRRPVVGFSVTASGRPPVPGRRRTGLPMVRGQFGGNHLRLARPRTGRRALVLMTAVASSGIPRCVRSADAIIAAKAFV